MSVKEIMSPVEAEMAEFEVRFREHMKSKAPLLDKVTHYIIRRKGKQMRWKLRRPLASITASVVVCAKVASDDDDSVTTHVAPHCFPV